MSRFSESMHMSTRSELVWGVMLLCASLVMRAVAVVSPVGLFRDVMGVFSVLVLLAGFAVVAVGLAHAALRKGVATDPEPEMSSATWTGAGAVIGVAIGCSIGAAYASVLAVAIGTAIGAGSGFAVARWWRERPAGQQHG